MRGAMIVLHDPFCEEEIAEERCDEEVRAV
jgi:hypothetical protein